MSLLRRLAQLFAPEQVSSVRPVRLAQYNTYDARALFSQLLERVRTGEEIVIARSGRPVAKLVPYAGEEVRPGLLRARVYLHGERDDARVGKP